MDTSVNKPESRYNERLSRGGGRIGEVHGVIKMQRERERARGRTREGRETREKSGSLKERVDGKPWHVGKKHTCQLVPRGCL